MKLVRHALEIARARRYATVEIEAESMTFTAQLAKPKSRAAQPAPDVAAELESPSSQVIKSSWVGFFGHTEPALKPGKSVESDTVVGVVTVLGIANEVVAGVTGDVEEVLVKEGDAVEFGQILFKVKP